MPTEIFCPHCQQSFEVNELQSTQQVNCPTCQRLLPTASLPPVVQAVNPYAEAQQAVQARASVFTPSASSPSYDPALRMLLPIDRSLWAIAAGYFGLFSVLCFPAPISIILGVVALRDIKKSNGQKHGAGRAWFGIVMGCLFSILPLVFWLLIAIEQGMR